MAVCKCCAFTGVVVTIFCGGFLFAAIGGDGVGVSPVADDSGDPQ